MKRVLAKTKWSEPKPLKSITTNSRTKDHWGKSGKPPYYDPYEDHIHIWKTGYLIPSLRFIENPFSEIRGRSRIQHHQLLARFCCICHKPHSGLDQVLVTSNGKMSKEEASRIIDRFLENRVKKVRLQFSDTIEETKKSIPRHNIIRWTQDDEDKLFDLHEDYGNNWKFIKTFFPNRSILQLERHWYSMNKPRVRDVSLLRDDPTNIHDNYYQLKKK